MRVSDEELIVLHGDRWDSDDSDGLLGLAAVGRRREAIAVEVVCMSVWNVTVWWVMSALVWMVVAVALMAVVWVHGTWLSSIAQCARRYELEGRNEKHAG